MADQEQALEFERVSKNFLAEKGKIKSVVADLSFDVRPGEFFSILGPSGCGKTTCLRMISGLERPTSGIIRIAGRVVNEVHPNQRNVHTVFQKYALFPHLNIFENVAFGLRMKKRPESEIRSRVERMLEMVQLAQDAKRSVQQLSGGEQQRVALVRALVNEPAILLLDEPLAALDLKLREQMQQELSSLQKKLGTTFVFVTHDQAEALTLSDRVAIMNGGRIEQVGTPTEVYEKPATAFVARFVGTTNLFEGNIAVRPEKIRIRVTAPDAAQVASGTVRVLRGTLIERIYFGPTTQIKLHVGDSLPPVIALVANQTAAKMPALKVGEKYYAVWDLADGVGVVPSRSGVENPIAVQEGVGPSSVEPVLMGTESPTS